MMDPMMGLGGQPKPEQAKLPFKQRMAILRDDYVSSTKGMLQHWRSRPLATTLWAVGLATTALIVSAVPNLRDYEDQLVTCMDELSEIPAGIRSRRATDYIVEMESLRAQRLLRVRHYGLFSLLHEVDYAPDNVLFAAHVIGTGQPNLVEGWKDSVRDFGFAGRWFLLDLNMKDCDIAD
eukprot:comp7219_c0_seq1/m.2930 comp7219_c0_seq1/g.2930  ORF comp7219_c0_seq1/g.2930 comp7219_c0_seq1/m.2930 type:complete len:179 (-) comp7219_c0_seq1:188-724(-)